MNQPIRPHTNATALKTGKRWPADIYPTHGAVWNGRVSLGNMTEHEILMISLPRDDGFFMGIVGHGCYRFGRYYKKSHYVAERLTIPLGDAENLADFMNELLGVRAEEQGTYDDRYCKDD